MLLHNRTLCRKVAAAYAASTETFDGGNGILRGDVLTLDTLKKSMSTFHLLLLTLLLAYVFLLVPHALADPDIWWHLRNAAQQLHTHAFLRQDAYSFTAWHAHWIDHEWLAEMVFYAGWHYLGEQGPFVVTVCVLECIFLGVFVLAYGYGRSAGAALAITMVAALLSTVSFGPRTLLFGWLGLVFELLLLQAFANGSSRSQRCVVWAMPLLFLFWVNTHGSWLIGVIILIAFLVCGCVEMNVGLVRSSAWTRTERRLLLLATSLTVISLFVNPYGWELVIYPFDLAFRQKLNVAFVQEWQSLDFHTLRAHIFLLSVLCAVCGQVIRPRFWTLFDLAMLWIGIYAAFTYSRFLFLAAILVLPLLARDLAGLRLWRSAPAKPRYSMMLAFGTVCLVFCRLHTLHRESLKEMKDYPQAAMPYLQNLHPKGRVWNDYLWGGYLEWHAPAIPVLIDSRVDIFERQGVLKDYLDAVTLKDPEAILGKYKVGYVFFSQDAPLVSFLTETHHWRVLYRDQTAVLLERCKPGEVCY